MEFSHYKTFPSAFVRSDNFLNVSLSENGYKLTAKILSILLTIIWADSSLFKCFRTFLVHYGVPTLLWNPRERISREWIDDSFRQHLSYVSHSFIGTARVADNNVLSGMRRRCAINSDPNKRVVQFFRCPVSASSLLFEAAILFVLINN